MTTFKERYQAARLEQVKAIQLKAFMAAPVTAEYVTVLATTRHDIEKLESLGWEITNDSQFQGGVYKQWVRQAQMRRKREAIRLDMEAAALVR